MTIEPTCFTVPQESFAGIIQPNSVLDVHEARPIGLPFTLFLNVAINLSMVGLAPVVEIPLRLMSFRGPAIMTVMIQLGIVMAIYRD